MPAPAPPPAMVARSGAPAPAASLWLCAHLLVFPPTCRACSALLPPLAGRHPNPPAGWPHLCPACHAGLPWWSAEAAEPIPGIDRVHAACRYTAPVDGWVRQLKYARRDGHVHLLAALLPVPAWPEGGSTRAPVLAPVPLHRRRLWQRGFNQSLLLARAWQRRAARWGGDPGRVPRVDPRLLIRHRYTTPQVRMSAEERRANVAEAFSLHRRLARAGEPPLAGRTVVLVDDVVTTGATLAACAAVLRQAGAESVEALVVARAQT